MTSVIQNFTWGVSLSSKDLFPAGLIVDPRTNCLVLNSRTGHVQFYNTHTKSLLYNVSNNNNKTRKKNLYVTINKFLDKYYGTKFFNTRTQCNYCKYRSYKNSIK